MLRRSVTCTLTRHSRRSSCRYLSATVTQPLTTEPTSVPSDGVKMVLNMSAERVGAVETLAGQITKLSLLETSHLVQLLKTQLNISDAQMMPVSAAPATATGASASPGTASAPVEEKKEEKTQFTLKLTGFNAASKAKLIKEIKGILPGANLVEAKKFVEGCTGDKAGSVVKEDVSKEEAEKMKKLLESVGGTVVLE